MNDEKKIKPDDEREEKKHIKPGEIQGKIEVTDLRERKDGPGGN